MRIEDSHPSPKPGEGWGTRQQVTINADTTFLADNSDPTGIEAGAVTRGTGPGATITFDLYGCSLTPIPSIKNCTPAPGGYDPTTNQLQYQVFVLLHEFGHVLGLLQAHDANTDVQAANNQAVLDHCAAQISATH